MKRDMRMEDHPLYRTWGNMRQRCYNPNNPHYENYGGRGIGVCERWRHDFWAFVDDMGPKPDPRLTLDREDNDKDYSPENCRWSTRTTQSRNKRARRESQTGIKGVTPKGRGYKASIGVGGKLICLGTFKTIDEAADARKAAEAIYWGCAV